MGALGSYDAEIAFAETKAGWLGATSITLWGRTFGVPSIVAVTVTWNLGSFDGG